MRVGIITFHWATNYGAVLQSYALQEYLQKQGHQVQIINYKPSRYDNVLSFKSLLKNPFLLFRMMRLKGREKLLAKFRENRLRMTKRFYSENELVSIEGSFDVLISGSDQILNPFFTMKGEGKPTSAYYLAFSNNVKRIGYAVSFGCTEYPEYARTHAASLINNFDKIGIRENTGKFILNSLGYKGESSLVPDPTILYGQRIFDNLKLEDPYHGTSYICYYLLRGEKAPKIKKNNLKKNVISDYDKPKSMERWLSEIKYCQLLVTNSYHGTIMAILFHVPFFAVLNQNKKKGMNDRFSTMLEQLGLQRRVINKDIIEEELIKEEINWDFVETRLSSFREKGEKFLHLI